MEEWKMGNWRNLEIGNWKLEILERYIE